MTITEDWTLVDQVAADPGVLASLERAVICDAIRAVARDTSGTVTAALIREAMSRPVNPHRLGAVISGFVSRGILVDTGNTARSGDRRNRNGNRRMPVFMVPDIEAVR